MTALEQMAACDEGLDLCTAMMVPTVAAMLADGVVEDDEVMQIMAICMQSPIYGDTTNEEDAEMIARAVTLVQENGYSVICKRAAERLSPALRETAFAFAVAIAFSDRRMDQAEGSLISRLIEWLEIDPRVAVSIISVIPVLQRTADS